METVPLAALRAHVVRAQGFATRHRRASAADVAAAVDRLSCVQLDSIATVDRSHRIALATRVGAFPASVTSELLREGRLFEYWGHEASLLPADAWPLLRRRMRERRVHHWFGDEIGRDPALARKVLRDVRAKGPLAARDFEGERTSPGAMWNWKPAKRMLDALWTAGRLAIAGRDGFERLYDLPERVIPRGHREAKVPSEAATLRALALRAVRGRGALTARGVKEHWRLDGAASRLVPHLDALARAGELKRVAVDDGGADAWVPTAAELEDAPAPRGETLLSPFDNLLWDRAFAERLFGFRHVIEVYKRGPQRKYGYYVLPLLVGDSLVARADLKADRAEGALVVRALHLEPGAPRDATEDAFARAAERLARAIGLGEVRRSRA